MLPLTTAGVAVAVADDVAVALAWARVASATSCETMVLAGLAVEVAFTVATGLDPTVADGVGDAGTVGVGTGVVGVDVPVRVGTDVAVGVADTVAVGVGEEATVGVDVAGTGV